MDIALNVSVCRLCVANAAVAKFDTDLFFLLLLPPIIFEAGYNMQRRKFFSNLGAICCYAFIGTAVSAVIIAAFVYYAGKLGSFFAATAVRNLRMQSVVCNVQTAACHGAETRT